MSFFMQPKAILMMKLYLVSQKTYLIIYGHLCILLKKDL